MPDRICDAAAAAIPWDASVWQGVRGVVHRNDDFGELELTATGNAAFVLNYHGWRLRLDPAQCGYAIEKQGAFSPQYVRERLAQIFVRLCRGALIFHAGGFAIGGRAYAVLAPGGVGKSTLTAGILAVTPAVLASDDSFAVVPAPDAASPLALPSSTHLAMRHAMFSREAFVTAASPLGDKTVLQIAPSRCLQGSVPLCGLVFLHPGAPRCRRIDARDALPEFLAAQMSLSDAPDAFRRRQFAAAMRILRATPCLRCDADLRSPSAVRVSVDTLISSISGNSVLH